MPTNAFMMSPVTADVLPGGKMGTNPGMSKNETGAPCDFASITTDM